MQAQGSLLQGSMMSNFINIYQTEGTRGLWRVSAVCFVLVLIEFLQLYWTLKHKVQATATGGSISPVVTHVHVELLRINILSALFLTFKTSSPNLFYKSNVWKKANFCLLQLMNTQSLSVVSVTLIG